MESLDLWFDALGHFFGGRPQPGGELVRFGIAALLWGGLFLVAWRRKEQPEAARERLLLLGFGFGFAREGIMFIVFLRDFFTHHPKSWPLIFPPLEHALAGAAAVVIAAAFIQYLRNDERIARRYLWAGLVGTGICYLSTFLWWPAFLLDYPQGKFGQTWCDWLFHTAGVMMSIWAIVILAAGRGWLRNLVLTALAMFLLDDLLKIVDMATAEQYESYFAPIRHGMHNVAVAFFGVVYLQEMLVTSSRLAAAVRNSGDSIVIFSIDRTIEYVNPTFTRYTGYEPAEVLGMRYEELLVSGKHSAEFYRSFWDRLESGRSWRGRMFTPRKGGGEFEGERVVTPLKDKGGGVTGYVSVTRDMTHEREIERRMMQAQKMEAIGTLAGGIAHDFNNLLTPIMGFTEVTRSRMKSDDPLRGNLDQVMVAADRARELVGQVLTISRQRQQEKQPIEVLPLVKQSLNLLGSSLPSTIEIRRSLLAGHSLVHADASQINQVVINLVTNAGQAMGESGGVLEVGLEEVVVDAEFAARHVGLSAGIYLCLSVRDSGPGLPADMEERIFEPFFTTKGDSGGTGLGLAIVRGIVQDHQGAIEVESSPRSGTLFRVFLPLVEGQAVPAEVPLEVNLPGKERILLVDDEKTIVGLGRQALENLGYRVTGRVSALEALELIESDPGQFDMLVTDQTMPKMTGLTLAQRAISLSPELPVVLCTGYLKEDTRQRASEAGIRVVLPKPYSMSELNQTIRHVFDG